MFVSASPGLGVQGCMDTVLGHLHPQEGSPRGGFLVPRSRGQGVAVLWPAPSSSETGTRPLLAVRLMSDGFLNCSP